MKRGSNQAFAPVGGTTRRVDDPIVAVVAREAGRREQLTAVLAAGGLEISGRAWDAEGLVLERADEPAVIVHFCDSAEHTAALRLLTERFSEAHVVIVVLRATQHAARKALEAGIVGLVLDADVDAALCLAVRSVAAGQLSIPISLTEGLEKPVLSSREKQVLGMVAMGFTNGQIAGRLYLAESTVKSHMSSIFGKLGVRSRREAAELVLDKDAGLGTGILAISDDPRGEHLVAQGPAT